MIICGTPTTPSTRDPAFLRLPREIRNMIYGYLLGPNVIQVKSAVIGVRTPNAAPDWSSHDVDFLYPYDKLMVPLRHRSTWTMPMRDMEVLCTYQRYTPTGKGYQAVELGLFQACQQIYAEVSELFYGKRTFSFISIAVAPTVGTVPTATAFLKDRSSTALGAIRSFEIGLHELLTEGGEYGDYPEDAPARLAYVYDYYLPLCELLSSRCASLRHLSLHIRSEANYEEPQSTFPTIKQLVACDFIEPEESWYLEGKGLPASWVYPLLEIAGLEELSVSWILTSPMIQRELDTVVLMRQRLLKGALEQTKKLEELEFRTFFVSESDGPIDSITDSSLAWYSPSTGQIRCQHELSEKGNVFPEYNEDLYKRLSYEAILHFGFARICCFDIVAAEN